MIKKRTVFVLGAGASCPYGYPSGACLREIICFDGGFRDSYFSYLQDRRLNLNDKDKKVRDIQHFIKIFKNAHIKSIDVFMANNPKLASTGKYILSFEIFRAELNSRFGEEAKREQERLDDLRKTPDHKRYLWGTAGFQGGDWYFYLYNRFLDGLIGIDALPDFSDGNITFITFNYDRSLEQFLYNSLRCLYSEVPEDMIIQTLKKLKIIHVYGKIAPLKWENQTDFVDYKQQIDEPLLERTAKNIETIYEVKENPELIEANNLLKQAEVIFFLGFGYAPENMKILGLPESISPKCQVYGTAFNMIKEELDRLNSELHSNRARDNNVYTAPKYTQIDNVDCLMLLRKYLR